MALPIPHSHHSKQFIRRVPSYISTSEFPPSSPLYYKIHRPSPPSVFDSFHDLSGSCSSLDSPEGYCRNCDSSSVSSGYGTPHTKRRRQRAKLPTAVEGSRKISAPAGPLMGPTERLLRKRSNDGMVQPSRGRHSMRADHQHFNSPRQTAVGSRRFSRPTSEFFPRTPTRKTSHEGLPLVPMRRNHSSNTASSKKRHSSYIGSQFVPSFGSTAYAPQHGRQPEDRRTCQRPNRKSEGYFSGKASSKIDLTKLDDESMDIYNEILNAAGINNNADEGPAYRPRYKKTIERSSSVDVSNKLAPPTPNMHLSYNDLYGLHQITDFINEARQLYPVDECPHSQPRQMRRIRPSILPPRKSDDYIEPQYQNNVYCNLDAEFASLDVSTHRPRTVFIEEADAANIDDALAALDDVLESSLAQTPTVKPTHIVREYHEDSDSGKRSPVAYSVVEVEDEEEDVLDVKDPFDPEEINDDDDTREVCTPLPVSPTAKALQPPVADWRSRSSGSIRRQGGYFSDISDFEG